MGLFDTITIWPRGRVHCAEGHHLGEPQTKSLACAMRCYAVVDDALYGVAPDAEESVVSERGQWMVRRTQALEPERQTATISAYAHCAACVFQLEGVSPLRTRLEVARARGLTRFVGRDAEMDVLETALARARAGNGQVIGVVAEAGTGKSRLCWEFTERCRAAGLRVIGRRRGRHGTRSPRAPRRPRSHRGAPRRPDRQDCRRRTTP